jgi:type I restriction enzyme R subunit
MAIAGMVYKMNGTDAPDTETMNRRVAKMVEEALKYNKVESILEDGEEMDIFGPEFIERLNDIKMPASKLELLIKLLRQQITDYGKTNQVAAKKFQEMLEATIKEYNERRKFLSDEEAGATQEETAESIIQKATEQALKILQGIREDRESFRKLGLTFEEKAFYDILIHLRDKYNFVYGEDKTVDGIVINERCMSLARKVKKIIDEKSSFTDWLNNQLVRNQLKLDIKLCLVKNGYPPQYTPEVFKEVMGQVENFKKNDIAPTHANILPIDTNDGESNMPMAAEDIFIYGSIPVDLPQIHKTDLLDNRLDLILMYAIGSPAARKKTESCGKIAIGIKEEMLKDEQIAAYQSVKYILFHYWSNPVAYALTAAASLVDNDSVPTDYLKRQEKDAVKFLLLEYNPAKSADLGNIDILKIQRRETKELRYLPFVTTIESIQK